MNIIHFLSAAIIFMGETEPYVVEDSVALATNEQWTLLRKLQNFNEPRDEDKPLTWNEILADVLVNRIKIFSFKQLNGTIEEKKSPLTNFMGQMLFIYKRFIYDRFSYSIDKADANTANATEIFKEAKNVTNEERDVEIPNHYNDTIVNHTNNSTGPKDEVEIIEPKYHGKLSVSEEVADLNKEVVECPEGFVMLDKVCVNEKSRLILAVPNQCPIGYKRDRLGYCRLIF
ncbi:uncharacterized protein LOC115451314 [Manduca sexta]|uniref:uncharacterized protein LOC115451314 n=1 Tax=Manduca sexta TaxID=7130 RepID=UPI00188F88CF|nr:uncharacterized protein LOC115451314 [Manduca sexta]